MSIVSSVLIMVGSLLCLVAALGLHRFDSQYMRVQAAGKASPVGFVLVGVGAAIEMRGSGAGFLVVAVLALAVTVPFATHLLTRALRRRDQSD